MDGLYSLSGIGSGGRVDDDKYDRLNHRVTRLILLVFAVVATPKQFASDRIYCWVPKYFSDYWEDYTNQCCWVNGTYYLPLNASFTIPAENEKREILPYYQWVPFILMIQAILFHLPCSVWRSYNERGGIDLDDYIIKSEAIVYIDDESIRKRCLNNLSFALARFTRSLKMQEDTSCTISIKHLFGQTCLSCFGRNHGNYLVTLYIFIKMLFIINVVSQFFLLSAVLGTEYHTYGFEALRMMAEDEDYMGSPAFPRVTMCDFWIRRLGNVHRYTVQCLLPINLFNEKMYLFIYFWFILVGALTIGSLVSWIWGTMRPASRYNFLQRKILTAESTGSEEDGEGSQNEMWSDERGQIERFVNEELQADGVFVLQLVSRNADAVTAMDIMRTMYQHFKEGKFHESHEDREDREGLEPCSSSDDDDEKPGTSRDSSVNETAPLIDKQDAANNF